MSTDEVRSEAARYEVKMTCDEILLPEVRSWVRLHPDAFIEAYPSRQVNSIYFDTPQAQCFEDNLIGARERTKLRFRWYGTDLSSVQGVLELKCKQNQLGWKKRCPIPATVNLEALSWNAFMQQVEAHASGSFALWLSCADRPTLISRYVREYYETMDRQVRLTIDHGQEAYEQVFGLAPNLSARSLLESRLVVEVKSDAAFHRRVSNLLSSLPLQVERNSKYVNGLTGSLCFV